MATRAALSPVLTSWSGSLVVTSGGLSTTVAPRVRESVASLWARAIHDAYVELGLTLTLTLSGTQFTVSGSAAFDLVFSGQTAVYLDFGGTYSGATSYASDDYQLLDYGFQIPGDGMRLDGADLGGAPGRVASDGSGAVPGVELGQALPLQVATDHVLAWSWETGVVGVYDVWHGGRTFGRVRIDGWRRIPVGRLRSGLIVLEAQAQAVSE